MIKMTLSSLALGLALSSAAFAETHEVQMLNKGDAGNMVFEPSFLKIAVGNTVLFVPTDKTPVAVTSDQENSEGTKSVDDQQDVTVSPPDSDAFLRLAASSDGSDGDFQLASEPTLTVDTADSDSFVIDNTLPAPLDNGDDTNSFSIGDDEGIADSALTPPEFSIGGTALVPLESNDFELANTGR